MVAGPSPFTTTAMSAALEETPITYEELADIENEFEDAETEISVSPLPSLRLLNRPIAPEKQQHSS